MAEICGPSKDGGSPLKAVPPQRSDVLTAKIIEERRDKSGGVGAVEVVGLGVGDGGVKRVGGGEDGVD
jgi:hypothetical protein